jgi:hypothetical protein
VSELERRYRRLLALYPRDHREQHGEEMLGVLMAAAGDRSRPGRQDVADLLWGALRLHLRRLIAADVLAIVSLLGPIAILAGATVSLHELAWWVQGGAVPPFEQIPDAPVWFVWLAVAVLAVFGKQRAAAAGAWLGTAALVWLATQPAMGWRWDTAEAGWVLLGPVIAVALTLSPGPGRGRELTGRWSIPVMAATVLVVVAIGVLGHRETVADVAQLVVLAAGAALAARVWSRAGSRATIVLLVPVVTTLLTGLVWSVHSGPVNDTVTTLIFFGVPLALLVATGGLVRLSRRTPVS